MLSFLALGALTASASNNAFKNYYSDKSENPPQFIIKYNYLIEFWSFDKDNFGKEIVHWSNTYCWSSSEKEAYWWIISERHLSYPNTSVRVTKGSMCNSIFIP